MKRVRGFRLKHRVTTLFRFISRRNGTFSWYQWVDPPASKTKTIFRLFSCLKTKAKTLCSAKPDRISGRAYAPLEDDDDHRLLKEKAPAVPKGHMAVYVGQKDDDFHRFLVPVIYFNHPLFGELLRKAEEEFGFNHPGGITIPCRLSEFERVQTRIAAASHSCRKFLTWKKASRR